MTISELKAIARDAAEKCLEQAVLTIMACEDLDKWGEAEENIRQVGEGGKVNFTHQEMQGIKWKVVTKCRAPAFVSHLIDECWWDLKFQGAWAA